LQLFAWQSAARGNDVHLNANPTQGEILHEQYKEKKDAFKETSKSRVLAKYGGEEYLEEVPKELLNGQTEDYVEYSKSGAVVKGVERAKARSKYDEDGMLPLPRHWTMMMTRLSHFLVYIGNHTSVWGSWYDLGSGQWGFACCHSTISNSYCTGFAGIEASKASSAEQLLKNTPTPAITSSAASELDHREAERQQEQAASRKKHGLGEGDVRLDKDRLTEALRAEKRKHKGDEDEWQSDKKRKQFGSSWGATSTEVTEEELEAYRMARVAGTEDPVSLRNIRASHTC